LRKQLREVRDLGYSVDENEHRIGVRGVGVPIFDYTNKVVAALSVLLLPSHTKEDIERIASKLKSVANEISRRLGSKNT